MSLRIIASVLVLFTTLLFAGGANADLDRWEAYLDGTQEIPPVPSAGIGYVSLWFEPATENPIVHVEFQELSGVQTATVLYTGDEGTNGDPLYELPRGRDADFTIDDMSSAQLAQLSTALRDGMLYVRIASEDFPEGEIRGRFTLGHPIPLGEASIGCLKSLYR